MLSLEGIWQPNQKEEKMEYSTDFGRQGFWKRKCPLGFHGAFDTVPQRAHALLPVPSKSSPLDLPHGRIT